MVPSHFNHYPAIVGIVVVYIIYSISQNKMDLNLVIASAVVHLDGLDILQHTDGKFPWHPSGWIEQRLLCSTSNLLATHIATPGHLRTVETTNGLILAKT